MYLKVEPDADADLALAVGSGWDKEILTREFLCGGRFGTVVAERLEIDILGSVTENGSVQNVVEFDHWPEAHSLTEFPLAGDAHIEREKTWAVTGIARQVAAFCADRLERKLRNKRV